MLTLSFCTYHGWNNRLDIGPWTTLWEAPIESMLKTSQDKSCVRCTLDISIKSQKRRSPLSSEERGIISVKRWQLSFSTQSPHRLPRLVAACTLTCVRQTVLPGVHSRQGHWRLRGDDCTDTLQDTGPAKTHVMKEIRNPHNPLLCPQILTSSEISLVMRLFQSPPLKMYNLSSTKKKNNKKTTNMPGCSQTVLHLILKHDFPGNLTQIIK